MMFFRSEKYDDRQRLMDYRATFGSPEGKRVLHDLIGRHFILGSTFSPEPTTTAFSEGQREVVLQILRYMQMRPADIEAVRAGVLAQFELEPADADNATR